MKKENVIFIGLPGVDKTHLAIAIGMKVLTQNYKVLFTTCYDMITNLVTSKADNTYFVKMKQYLTPDLLIIRRIRI